MRYSGCKTVLLWHHPRKYVVPAVMLLLAGGACVMSEASGVMDKK